MATKKAAAETPKAEKQEPFLTSRTGVDIPPADREVLQQPIDKRMAALLKDHKEMGAR
jgi:hypothetical protein